MLQAFLATLFAVALAAHHLWWVRRQRSVPLEAWTARIIRPPEFTRALAIVERYQENGRGPPPADIDEVFAAYAALLDRDYGRTEQLRALQRGNDNLREQSPAEQRGAPPLRFASVALRPRFVASCTTCLRDLTSVEIEFVRNGGIFEASGSGVVWEETGEWGEASDEASDGGQYTCLCAHCGSQVEMTGRQ